MPLPGMSLRNRLPTILLLASLTLVAVVGIVLFRWLDRQMQVEVRQASIRLAALQLSANAASVAVYTSDGASVEVRGSAESLHLMARDSTVAVTDFDAVRAVVDLREESVGRIDGLSAELAYRVYDESELYYAPGTRLGQPYHVGDDATFSTL